MPEETNAKRREISEIGKMATIAGLFENSGYENREIIKLPATVDSKEAVWASAQKTQLEGIDFDLVYTPLNHLGYKAALSAIGELYAKLFRPWSLTITLGLSKRFFFEDVEKIWKGIMAAAKEYGIKEISLDLNPSITGLCISISAQGYACKDRKTPQLSKSDIIFITGNLGAAYMGLHVLEREKAVFVSKTSKQPDLTPYKFILAEYLSPYIRKSMFDVMENEGITPTSGYFITKGLAASVKQLAADHNVGVKIYMEKIPIAKQTFDMADEINMDPVTAALNGGDDYKFMFTVPVGQFEKLSKELPDMDVIGHLCDSDNGTTLITPEGGSVEIRAQGW